MDLSWCKCTFLPEDVEASLPPGRDASQAARVRSGQRQIIGLGLVTGFDLRLPITLVVPCNGRHLDDQPLDLFTTGISSVIKTHGSFVNMTCSSQLSTHMNLVNKTQDR